MPPRLSPTSLHAIQPLKAFRAPSSISPILRTLPPRPLLPRKSFRPLSQRGPQRPQQRPQYNRFGRPQAVYDLWLTSPYFRYGVGAVGLGGGTFYILNLEKVPVTGRRRFNCYSPAQEKAMAESVYQMLMQDYGQDILPPSHPDSKLVNKVMGRLIVAAGLEGENWEVKVINDPNQQNAFVLPGGQVFVYSGILPICAGEDGLAAVLGHELAHNVVHHSSEKMSRMLALTVFAYLFSFVFDISSQFSHTLLEIAFSLPGSRKMESEADYVGLLMMAEACYDPNKAVGLWERMAKAEKGAVPQILSTHPASKRRMMVIQEWLPQAQQKRAESECSITSGYMDDFTRVFGHEGERFW